MGWGGNARQWEQVRTGLAFSSAYLNADVEGSAALLGGEDIPEVAEVLDGLVALVAAMSLMLPDGAPLIADMDSAHTRLAALYADWCSELSDPGTGE